MGAVIKTTAGKIAGQLKKRNQATLRAIARGALRGAHRGRAIIVRETPVDQSQLKQAWKVKPGNAALLRGERVSWARFIAASLAELRNDAPHAGIVELGARPHKVSAEGWMAIYDWVVRHRQALGLVNAAGRARRSRKGKTAVHPGLEGGGVGLDVEFAGITWAIVKKIGKEGQEPTYFVKGSLPLLLQAVEIEVEKAINEVAGKPDKAGA